MLGSPYVLEATDHERMPQCTISGPRGYAKDIGTCRKAVPLVWNERGHRRLCEDLSYMSRGQIRQQD